MTSRGETLSRDTGQGRNLGRVFCSMCTAVQWCKSLFEVGGLFYGREAISSFSGGLCSIQQLLLTNSWRGYSPGSPPGFASMPLFRLRDHNIGYQSQSQAWKLT